jgi:anthranilate synthase component 2
MQAIGEVFGAKLKNLSTVYHGIQTKVKVNSKKELLFKNLGPEIKVGRYHSWVVEDELPDCFDITSVDENGQIMAIRHKELDVKGVQFHPESVLTPDGKTILKNWINS